MGYCNNENVNLEFNREYFECKMFEHMTFEKGLLLLKRCKILQEHGTKVPQRLRKLVTRNEKNQICPDNFFVAQNI